MANMDIVEQIPPQTIEDYITDKVTGKLTFYGRGGTTYHGHGTDEVKSLMQKSVRRGNVDIAMYCALEFDGFNSMSNAKAMVTGCMNRLLLMVSEDVGIGCPRLPEKINELYKIWEENPKDIDGKSCLLDIVNMLCQAYKSRYASYVNNVYIANIDILRKLYPDFYEDIESSYDETINVSSYYKGDDKEIRKIYQGLITNMESADHKYFYWLGLLLASDSNNQHNHHLTNMWKLLKDYASNKLKPSIIVLEHWYKTKKSENRIHLLNANLCVINEEQLLLDVPESHYSDGKIWQIIRNHYTRPPIDIAKDHFYALDRHTRVGKAHPIRRFHMYFAIDGARVSKNLVLEDNKDLKKLYYAMKDITDLEEYNTTLKQYLDSNGLILTNYISEMKKSIIFIGDYLNDGKIIGKESEVMHNPLRINVTTKTPTYFATMKHKKYSLVNVFVKGPIAIPSTMWYSVLVDELKPLFGLNKIGIKICKMVADLYTDKGESYFYIMRDLGSEYNENNIKYEQKDGIVIKEKLPHPPISKWNSSNPVDHGSMEYYFDILLFRQMIATTDTNNSNIIVFPDQKSPYLSIDENYGTFNMDRLYRNYPGKKYGDMVTNYMLNNKKEIETKLRKWKDISLSDDFEIISNRYDDKWDADYITIFRHNIDKMLTLYCEKGFRLE